MILEEMHQRLTERFKDSVMPLATPECGDGCIQIVPETMHGVCQFLRDDPELCFDFLRLVTGVDREECLSSMYHLYSYAKGHSVVLRVDVSAESPRVPSVKDIWPAAEWHERESFDMMGIVYDGHEGLRRILLPDDWPGFPLRKDYEIPSEYHEISNE